ncbi:MAG: hypothetical protein IT361_04730 [Gemmatimonadaceae bacterium]|nr:hypothetical protein [Gemmatimonadaceae bacterium]
MSRDRSVGLDNLREGGTANAKTGKLLKKQLFLIECGSARRIPIRDLPLVLSVS